MTLLEDQLRAKEAEVGNMQSQTDAACKASELALSQQLSNLKALHAQAEQHLRQQLAVQAKQLETEVSYSAITSQTYILFWKCPRLPLFTCKGSLCNHPPA